MKNTFTQKGFSTIELLIAFAIAITFISGAMMVAFGGQTAGLDTIMTTTGLYRTTTQIGDAVRAVQEDWSTSIPSLLLAADPSYTHTNGDTSAPQAFVSNCRKNIGSTVSWNSEHGRTLGMSFGTALVNMEEAMRMGPGGCSPIEPGEWDNPENTGWNVTPSELDGHGTGIAITTINDIPYAIVTTEQNGANKHDIWAIDISNPLNPGPASGPVPSADVADKGLNGIVVAFGHAYVLHNNSTNQLQVIDISNPTSLSASDKVFETSLPNILCVYDTSNCRSIGRSIAYYDGYLYIGTGSMQSMAPGTDPEFHVYCIDDTTIAGCSPTTPVHVSDYKINHDINDIAITRREVGGVPHTYAILATSVSAVNHPELTILDVTDAKNDNISLKGEKRFPGDLSGTSVFVVGDTAYLGRERAAENPANCDLTNNCIFHDFYVLNIANNQIMSPTIIKGKRLNLSSGSALIDMVVQGRLAFLVINDPTDTFQVWDVGFDNTEIVPVSTCSNILNLQKSRALAYWNDLIYIVNDNNAALNTIHDNPLQCP